MRFSKRNYPILNNISNFKAIFKFQEIGLSQALLKGEESDVVLDNLANSCSLSYDSGVIDFVSVPFFDKIINEKIFNKMVHLFTSIKDCEGILLLPKSRFKQIHAVSYVVYQDEEEDKELLGELQLYSIYGRIVVIKFRTRGDRVHWVVTASENIKRDSTKRGGFDGWVGDHVQSLLAILTFKQYAEIETKIIGGVKYPKKTMIAKQKYLNATDKPINILDSKWFIKTVRTEGFGVDGHFRFQACGKGLKERKLIYIHDFKKDGYTSRARINL